MHRLEKHPGITYTEISNRDAPELECLRLKLSFEKIAKFPRESFKARIARRGFSLLVRNKQSSSGCAKGFLSARNGLETHGVAMKSGVAR
jgi:hypothetical protein